MSESISTLLKIFITVPLVKNSVFSIESQSQLMKIFSANGAARFCCRYITFPFVLYKGLIQPPGMAGKYGKKDQKMVIQRH
jgi:hypothetical protein